MPDYGIGMPVTEIRALDEIGSLSAIAGKYRGESTVASGIVQNFLDSWREASSVFEQTKAAYDERDFATYNQKSERLRQIHESCLFLFGRLLKVIPAEKAWAAKSEADAKTFASTGNQYNFVDSGLYGSESKGPVPVSVPVPSPVPWYVSPDILKKAGIFLALTGTALAIVAFLRRR